MVKGMRDKTILKLQHMYVMQPQGGIIEHLIPKVYEHEYIRIGSIINEEMLRHINVIALHPNTA